MKHINLFEDFKNHTERFPSKNFGEATGIDWIYVDWKLPMHADEAGYNVEKWVDSLSEDGPQSKEAGRKIQELYHSILKFNPDFSKLGEPKSWEEILDFIRGAISKFNIDDIKFYSGLTKQERFMNNQKNRAVLSEIENESEADINWVPSPATVKRLKKELNIE